MKELIRVFLIIASIFAISFIIIKVTGILTLEDIEEYLQEAKDISPLYVGLLISFLLFADLFIAVPTLSIIILSGYFLGFMLGAVFSIIGVFLAGFTGYILSRYYGENILLFLIKEENKRLELIKTFNKHGFVMILLSRAMPIIPETTACLSGMTLMPFKKFTLAWSLSSIPYVLLASYAGSISSLQNPKPVILTAIFLSLFFWITWYFYHKRIKSKNYTK